MKNKLIIISIIPIIFIFVFFQTNTSQNNIEIDGNLIDNNFNNTIVGPGKAVRQNNMIYYYYQPDGERIKNGLYQISKSEINRIYQPNILSLKDTPAFHLQSSANSILIGSINDTPIGVDLDENKNNYVVALDTSTNTFCNTTFFKNFKDRINYYYLIGEEIYFATDNYIFLYSNGKYTKLLNVNKIYHYEDYHNNPGFNGWYLAGKKIYYFSSIDGSFCSYDIINKTTEQIFDQDFILRNTKTKSIDEINQLFFVSGDKLVLTVSDTVFTSDMTTYQYYVLNIRNLNIDFIVKNSFYNSFSINVYNDILFLGSDIDGLRAVSLKDRKIYALTRNQVNDIYIFDSKYIYYVDNKHSLYRITNDGQSEEKIF